MLSMDSNGWHVQTLGDSDSASHDAPQEATSHQRLSMAWAPRLNAGAASSPMHMNVKESVENLRSFLDASPDMNEFEWSSDARDAILTHIYKTFWGSHSHCFVSEPLPHGNLLSFHQAETDPHYGADIPGMPCGHIFRKGDCCYKCKYVFPAVIF